MTPNVLFLNVMVFLWWFSELACHGVPCHQAIHKNAYHQKCFIQKHNLNNQNGKNNIFVIEAITKCIFVDISETKKFSEEFLNLGV